MVTRCVSLFPPLFDSNTAKVSSIHLSKLHSWATDCRHTYLEELHRLDGRGTSSFSCRNDDNQGTYRCIDCFDTNLYCNGCIVRQHVHAPLHRIEVCSLSVAPGLWLMQSHRPGRMATLFEFRSATLASFYVSDTTMAKYVPFLATFGQIYSLSTHQESIESRSSSAAVVSLAKTYSSSVIAGIPQRQLSLKLPSPSMF